jgi:Fe-S cluster assembly iron-binding protein IscA
MNQLVRVAWFLLATAVLPTATLASVSVSLAPATVHVPLGGQTQFTATVSGTSNSVVIWNLSGTSCSGNVCGQISSGGVYSAPATAPASNVITVTATSLADLTASASASIILGSTSDIAVSVSPTQVTLLAGQQQRFLALVTGTTLTGVTWQLTSTGCSGSACGTLTSTGLYTAPASVSASSQVTVTATSVADSAKSGSAVITLTPPVAVSISPTVAQVTAGTQKQFTATVTGTSNTAVSWSLVGSGCSGVACGTISAGGLYIAPSTVPAHPQLSVTATSVADPTKSASALVTIVPAVSVTVSPSVVQLFVLGHQQFTATVTGTSNALVTWSIGNCSGSACGTISTSGLYTAPSAVPSSPQISIMATSVADPTKSASATVTIVPPVSIAVLPITAQLLSGSKQQFTAKVTGTSNTTVSWSVAGSGCSGAACGTISTSGLYTAPAIVPSPPQISITATSAADPTKSATASVTIVPPISVTVSPSTAQLLTGGHQQFTATVIGASNTAVSWSVAGSGCSGATCGTISTSGLYTAPGSALIPNQITVTATSVADGSKSGRATVLITGPVSVYISPTAVDVVIGGSQQFSTTVRGTSNTGVSWSVVGNGCSGTSCGTISPSGLYFAPAAVPNPAQVFVTATSAADATKSSTATVTVIPPIIVSLSPTTATLTAGGQQKFTATVTGSSNTGIAWSVSGSGCSGVSCGSISSAGLYTAPTTVPNPAQITVKAASVVDTSSFRTATVTIIPPVVVSVSPAIAELVAGNDEQFTATVSGTTNHSVTWTVTGNGCSGLACGTITSTGFYGAPGTVPNPDRVTVTATSVADTGKSGSAVVTILPPVAVSISPTKTQVATSSHLQFTTIVTGTTNTSVNWSLAGSGCSGSACGTISSSGLYTAPAAIPNPPQVTVKATSEADSTKSASAILTVIPPVLVAVAPTSAVVAVNGQQQFRATIAGSTNTSVDWSISGAACTGSSCGSITSAGLYTAPSTVPTLATIIVKATSQIDVSQSASAIVTVVANLNSKLQGQYAFNFTGFDASGVYRGCRVFNRGWQWKYYKRQARHKQHARSHNGSLAFTGKYQVSGDNHGTLSLR